MADINEDKTTENKTTENKTTENKTTENKTTENKTTENKTTVLAFYKLAFNDRPPADAVVEYVGRTYRQHNPLAADGPVAFIQFVQSRVQQFPDLSFEIKRVVAEGDLVVTHSLMKTTPQDRGTAVVDIFRLEEGNIVEHWDVLQPVPESSANDNTMF